MHDPDSDDPNIQLGSEGLFQYVTPLSGGTNFRIVEPLGTPNSQDYLLSVQRSAIGQKAAVMYFGAVADDNEVVTKKFVDDAVGSIDVSDQIDGKLSKKGDTANGDYDFDGDCLVRVKGDVVIKDKGESIGGANLLGVYREQQRVQYWGKVDEDLCIATKEYVDNNGGGTGVEDVGSGSLPTSRVRGSLVLKDDKLYYYI